MSKKNERPFIITIYDEKKDKYKEVVRVKYRYENLNNEEKEIVLEQLIDWVKQQLNELYPEQE